MIEKIFGLSDKSIMKKSNYYVYLFSALLGMIVIIIAIGFFIFQSSDTYQGIALMHNSNMEYLTSLSQTLDDKKLLNIAEAYKSNAEALTEQFQIFSGLLLFLGFGFILNFVLFKKLRN